MQYKIVKQYKGHLGSIEYSNEDQTFLGKIQEIDELVSYEGKTLQELEKNFQIAVDEYLELLKEH